MDCSNAEASQLFDYIYHSKKGKSHILEQLERYDVDPNTPMHLQCNSKHVYLEVSLAVCNIAYAQESAQDFSFSK